MFRHLHSSVMMFFVTLRISEAFSWKPKISISVYQLSSESWSLSIHHFRGKIEDLVLVQCFKHLKANWYSARVTVCSCQSQCVLSIKHRIIKQKNFELLQFIQSLFSHWTINWVQPFGPPPAVNWNMLIISHAYGYLVW